jgi:hypothetical protein
MTSGWRVIRESRFSAAAVTFDIPFYSDSGKNNDLAASFVFFHQAMS